MADNTKKPPYKEAVALEYNPELEAPRVVAAGQGFVAEKIIDIARKAGVPVTADPELAHVLNQLQIGDFIPPELYTVVAQILLFVCHIDEKMGLKK
jgi:flagellar biosynthesis protein